MKPYTQEEKEMLKALDIPEDSDVTIDYMTPFAEAYAIMEEYVHSIVLVGPATPLSDTNHLGEETDEDEEDSEPPVKKRDIRK